MPPGNCRAVFYCDNPSPLDRLISCLLRSPRLRSQKHIIAVVTFLLFVAIAVCTTASNQESDLDKYEKFINNLPNGFVDVEALNLPDQFVTRIASRSLRSAFRKQYRKVPNISNSLPKLNVHDSSQLTSSENIILLTGHMSEQVKSRWLKYGYGVVPPLRGFRAPVSQQKNSEWMFGPATQENSNQYQLAATYAAQNLAQMGLIRTTMNIMQQFDLPWLLDNKLDLTQLQAVGIPSDLLEFFMINDKTINQAMANWFRVGSSKQGIEQYAAHATFKFTQSHEGFEAIVDDGSEPIGAVRMQLPIAGYQTGPTDGSTLDVLRQFFERDSNEQLWASVHKRNLEVVSSEITKWETNKSKTIRLVSTPAPFTRWAQDNAKPGSAFKSADQREVELITLLPRYANQNEQMSKFYPGDSLLFEVIDEVVGRCVSSPLLFQGGNLLIFKNPTTGKRIMLLGEAEIYRNIALGLTQQQTIEAFKIEFAVDQIVIFPAITFHVDMEITLRRVGNTIVACIVDEIKASRIIIDEAISAFTTANLIDPTQLKRLQQLSADDDLVEIAKSLRVLTNALKDKSFSLTSKAASALVKTPFESPQLNGQRFLLAVDYITAKAMQTDKFLDKTISASEREYLNSLSIRSAEREELAAQLADFGIIIHRVPAFGDEEVGINYLNVVHLSDTVIFPSLGGFFEPLDIAAAKEFQLAFGNNVNIEPFATAAAQQAYGGVHCLVSLYPAKGLVNSKAEN